jgi:hypothetical protein
MADRTPRPLQIEPGQRSGMGHDLPGGQSFAVDLERLRLRLSPARSLPEPSPMSEEAGG